MTWLSDAVLAHVEQVRDAPELGGTKYELVEHLGRGGMGSVWLARDAALEREVAIKVSARAPDDTDGDRLAREARVLAQLEHPGIVPVHDFGTLPYGRRFYVMKRVRGARLDAWAGSRDLRARLSIFLRICEAVAFAHARGVLHRDLKPQNVMVGEFGEALVLDWGLARELPAAGAASLARPGDTQSGAVLGTPGYMPPEQARGEPATVASDVYGLGAILSGLVEPAAPRAIAAVCAKAMAEAPAERYAGATALADDVRRFLELEPVQARREPPLERLGRFASKNRGVLLLFGAYLLMRTLLFWLS